MELQCLWVNTATVAGLCLSSFAETVWPAEPEGFTAKLLKHLQPLISTKRETLASVFVRHHSILLNASSEEGTFPGHLLPVRLISLSP